MTRLYAERSSIQLTPSYRHFASANLKVIKVQNLGDSITEGTIQKWEKQPGDFVKEDDLVVLIETDKVVNEVRAPENGYIREHFAEAESTVLVNADLFSLEPAAAPEGGAAPAAAPKKEAPKETKEAPKAEEKPKVEKAKEVEKPLESTGTNASSSAAKKPEAKPEAKAAPAPTSSGSRTETRVKMNRMRLRIAERLKDSQNTYALLTTFNKVDMTNIMELRNLYKDEFATKHGVKLGFMSAFVKAAATALQQQPIVNAVIEGNEIVYRDFVDISVAVSAPTGLVVPVLRNVQTMNFAQIEKSIADYGKKAKDGKLAMEDMAGGTFTISNGGVFGSLMGTPILNPPQSAILGMHAINKEAVVINDKVEIRPIMYLALTYDHRLIDGREAVTFLKKIKETIEDPRRIVLDL